MLPGSDSRTNSMIKDDLSETILVVEKRDLKMSWMQPRDRSEKTLKAQHLTKKFEAPAAAMADGKVIHLPPLSPRIV
ncbi:MAG: hypothetical protein VXZ82_05095 [Planctomycetota bacterium]|nr:hypothetical protein [Planctomycetota bacterium]